MRQFFLNLTKNNDESEMKNKKAPMQVMIVGAQGFASILRSAAQFIVPLISKYKAIGQNSGFGR